MCGVFGITGAVDASKLTFLGLFALQHRGQESAGICSMAEGRIFSKRGPGLVSDVFEETALAGLPGDTAIGHVRYSTAGGNLEANIQPLTARIGGVPVALAHNGNIVNETQLRERLENGGAILQGTADSELVLHLLARSTAPAFIDRLMAACGELTGAFSMLVQTPSHLYAVIDAAGYRPLVLGKLTSPALGESAGAAPADAAGKPAWVVCSETCALDLVGAEYIRDLLPGEVLSIETTTGAMTSRRLPLLPRQSRDGQEARCVFEHIYFARPDSLLWNASTHEMRQRLGSTLAKEKPVEADMVIAIPDSGIPMAMGYAEGSGIPYTVGFIRNHYVGRTFIEPTQNVRNFRVRLKLNPVRETVRGKRLIVVDDSIVRGTTSKKIIELLRDAGAKEIHMRIGSPPVRFPCFYGIDTPKRKDLLAQRMELGQMRDFLRADSLAFLSKDAMLSVMQEAQASLEAASQTRLQGPSCDRGNLRESRQGFCVSCFTGTYQDAHAQEQGNPEGGHA
jgi:amidophosphoribosyltransferase